MKDPGFDINSMSSGDVNLECPPIYLAARFGAVECFRHLKTNGALLNNDSVSPNAIFYCAVQGGEQEIFETVLENCILDDDDEKYARFSYGFMYAVERFRTDMAEWLLDQLVSECSPDEYMARRIECHLRESGEYSLAVRLCDKGYPEALVKRFFNALRGQ